MLTLTRKTDYALVALTHLAERQRESAGPVSARLIAEAYNLPLPLLMNTLKELAAAKFITSTRGATGGYSLAVDPDQLTLLDVVTTIEGPVKLATCCDPLPIMGQQCSVGGRCPIKNSIQSLHHRLIDFFRGITLRQMLDASATEGSPQTCCRITAQVRSPLPRFPSDFTHPSCLILATAPKLHQIPAHLLETPAMSLKFPIYLDHNATTPADPRVIDTMLPYFTEHFGNAASRNHAFGWAAEDAVDLAREQVAKLIGSSAKEVIWTSGATESNNLAIKGTAEMYAEKGKHIISATHEHKAVLDPIKRLQRQGYEVTWLEPDADGIIYAQQVADAIREDTVLVTIMWANNELGTINEIPEIGKVCKDTGVIFHTDATQWVGKMPTDVEAAGIDLLSATGHKMYGPKGCGFLYVRRRRPRVRVSPLIDGGGHERGMRSGTLNVPGIVGVGKACELCLHEMSDDAIRLGKLKQKLEDGITSRLNMAVINGHKTKRLPHTTNISFPYVEGESLLMAIKEIAVSTGSACSSASLEPSYVLKALGLGDELAHSSIRFGLGRITTEDEIDYTIDKVVTNVEKLLEISPLWDMVQEGVDLETVQWGAH